MNYYDLDIYETYLLNRKNSVENEIVERISLDQTKCVDSDDSTEIYLDSNASDDSNSISSCFQMTPPHYL